MGLLILAAAVEAQGQAVPLDCSKSVPAFMTSLAKGDLAAIASRYSGKGAYSLGFGPKAFESFEAIGKRYAGPQWQKPDKFEWTDLSCEQLGPNHCLVAGGFNWTAGSRSASMANTAVLVRESGALRIILEHENMLAPPRSQK